LTFSLLILALIPLLYVFLLLEQDVVIASRRTKLPMFSITPMPSYTMNRHNSGRHYSIIAHLGHRARRTRGAAARTTATTAPVDKREEQSSVRRRKIILDIIV
jgi:hypothetical protein